MTSNQALTSPQRCRVLVIEDEPLIAEALSEDLSYAGFEVADVAHRLEKALRLIAEVDFDVAIVDANLAGTSAGPAAEALTLQGKPFLVMSGYSREQLSESFAGAAFVRKPYRVDELIGRLQPLLMKR